MHDNFSYADVPSGFMHCLHSACPRSSDCLRYLVATRADADVTAFYVLNPSYAAAAEPCNYFLADVLTRYAKGVTHLFTDLPHAVALRLKPSVIACFGHTGYYRVRSHQRLITPKEQAKILALFQREGLEEPPRYDAFVDRYTFIP